MNADTFATRHRSHLFLSVLIVGLAAVLRFFSLSALGYWTDEFCSLSCSHGWGLQFDRFPTDQILPTDLPKITRLSDARPFTAIIPAMVRDEAHPPLYFLLLRLWEDIFGDGECAVRSLDVAFSLLSVVLLFFAAGESVGATSALATCLLMAVATPQIQFSQEARNYMPVVAFSLAAVLAIQRLKSRPAAMPAIVLCLALLAMMLTHYFAAGTAAGLAAYALLILRGKARQYTITAFGMAAILFLLTWGPFLLRQLPNFQSNYAWIRDTNPDHLSRTLLTLCRLPLRLVGAWPDNHALQVAATIIGSLLVASLPIVLIKRPGLSLWIFWTLGSIGILVAVDLTRSTAQLGLLRYSLLATPAVYVLIAAAIPRGHFRLLPPLVAVIIALISLRDAYNPAWKIDFHTPAQMVAGPLKSDDGLLISGPDPVMNGVMFAAAQHYLPHMPGTCVILTTAPTPEVEQRLRQCPQVGVIWFWTDRQLPNFHVQSSGQIQYFGQLMRGSFKTPTTRP